ncbi:MAG: hypothetical protein FWF53_09155 [Candidatus Azobacteroides sp.]|nr:hypothetical protein [Candidatus Azobacteroides sp.]
MNEQARHIILEEVEALKKRIADNIVSTKQNASGETIKSLEIIETDDSVKLLGHSPFGTLETGRKPGKVPQGFQGIILQWMKDKGIKATPIPYARNPSQRWQPKYTPQQRGDMSIAGVIAHKIKTDGTKLYRDGGRADVYSNEIPVTLKNIRQKLAGLFATEIQTININAAK